MIKITLKDGTIREFQQGMTIKEIAGEISPGLKKKAIAGKLNGKNVDLNTEVQADSELEIIVLDSEEGLKIYRHSAAHILAQAVKRLYPTAKFGIGPDIENGFYYDISLETPVSIEELPKIEQEINRVIKEDHKISREVLTREEALKRFAAAGEYMKEELISGLADDVEISIYHQGEFTDLCSGPHLESTGKLKNIKLLSVAGAYWRGNSDNEMLTRIYGVAFPKKEDLDEYLLFLEEAKKRDHRKLGRELDLFSFSDDAPGMPLYHPKGMVLRNQLESFWRDEHRKAGYQEIKTPIILNRRLWEQSGHWHHYGENMYFTKVDDIDFAVKPMNCPGAMMIYKSHLRSYRDLPIRLAELGLVHRHELSGALNGLLRVRSFTQDDAHLFVLPDQIEEEISGVISLVDRFYKVFGFEYEVELSTRPEKSMGSDELWERATTALVNVLQARGMNYKVNEGDGAFYGPKIDFKVKDCLKRTWQCGTIQLDFQMPEKFDLNYIGDDNQKHRPVMLHRVVYGSMERFTALLIEHFAGALPIWLSPEQVRIIPVSSVHNEYAKQVEQQLFAKDIRVTTDDRNEKLGFKIREGQMEKVPYILVVGDKEVENGGVSVRFRGDDLGFQMVNGFLDKVLLEVVEYK
ncbi:threonine--tRNA ligase [Desulfuribacillus stibiiarsenatis]|uniref:Threonine--tRNA ligase n=1 Tax=Desulfuribacillus stibiiarsenatis TaxID=1390249 RepID=A0A1E5L2U2_9FIRM|nr:threonine--tRNA ligase [Desulfuribacillus stibiiarsenatis]OEH84442.1 threonine--tRNA ligase [Desulfuribacillus stibiiarsenatis]